MRLITFQSIFISLSPQPFFLGLLQTFVTCKQLGLDLLPLKTGWVFTKKRTGPPVRFL